MGVYHWVFQLSASLRSPTATWFSPRASGSSDHGSTSRPPGVLHAHPAEEVLVVRIFAHHLASSQGHRDANGTWVPERMAARHGEGDFSRGNLWHAENVGASRAGAVATVSFLRRPEPALLDASDLVPVSLGDSFRRKLASSSALEVTVSWQNPALLQGSNRLNPALVSSTICLCQLLKPQLMLASLHLGLGLRAWLK